MNRLKKKAWTELISCGIGFVLITIPLFLVMAHTNARGLEFVLIWVIFGVPTGLVMYLWEAKKLKQYDEREREIIQKAFSFSMMIMVLYLMGFSVAAFFLIGGGGSVPVVFMPLMFFTGMFLGQAVNSFIILMQCTKEDDE